MKLLTRLILSLTIVLLTSVSAAPSSTGDMNAYILKAVDMMARERAGQGYDIGGSFTQDLQYAGDCCIKSTKPHYTMCVAAVTEVLVEAINFYALEQNQQALRNQLPISAFKNSDPLSLRPYLFQYVERDGQGKKRSVSMGVAHALEIFGIGKQLPFEQLKPGDVVNFNRNTSKPSGHAVVFLGYLNQDGKLMASAEAGKAGFRYFSAQGKGDSGGLGYRNAWFDGFCPASPVAGTRNDCHVIRSKNPAILNAGRFLAPATWDVETAKINIEQRIARRVMVQQGGGLRDEAFSREVKRQLSADLEAPDLSYMQEE